jgi:hypothetical protein
MATSAAALQVDVTTNTASVEQGFNRLADLIQQRSRSMQASFDEVNSKLQGFGDTIKAITGIASVGAGIHLFTEMVKDTIDAQAHLQDLADKVGTTAAALSQLIPAARLSGTSMDDVAAASGKFSKSLLDVQAGTGKASQAFAAFGLSSKDAGRFLADPVAGMVELAKRSAEFAQDGNKTAAMLELLGKNAQGLAPFLRQLAESGADVIHVTNEQAAAAKRLQDQWAEMQLRSEDLRNTFVAGLVPGLQLLLTMWENMSKGAGGFREEVARLSGDGSLALWVINAAQAVATLVESLTVIGKAVYAFGGSVQAVIADIKLFIAGVKVAATGGLSEDINASFRNEIDARNKTLEESNKRWASLWDDNHTAVSDSLRKTADDIEKSRSFLRNMTDEQKRFQQEAAGWALGDAGAPRLPRLDTSGIGAPQVSEASKAIDKFRQMVAGARAELTALSSGEQFTKIQKAFEQLKQSDVWKTFSVGTRKAIEDLVAVGSGIEKTILANQQATREFVDSFQLRSQAVTKFVELEKSYADAAANVQKASLDQALTDADRSYQFGLSSFEAYWNKRTAIAQAQLNIQRDAVNRELQSEGDALTRIAAEIDRAQQNQANFKTPEGAFDLKAYQDTLNRLQTQYNDLLAKYNTTRGQANVLDQQATQIGKDYVTALVSESNGLLQMPIAINREIEARIRVNEEIGKTTEQIFALRIARVQELLDTERLTSNRSDVVAYYEDQIAALGRLRDVTLGGEAITRSADAYRTLFANAASYGASFLEDFAQHGTSAFKRVWDDFKHWAFQAFAEIAAKKIVVVGIVGAFSGTLAEQAAASLGTSGITGQIGGLSGGGNLLSGASSLGGLFSGPAGEAFTAGFLHPFSTAAELLTGGFGEFASSSLAFSTALGAAVPIFGALAIAVPLLARLFDSGPANRTAQFASNAGLGAGNPLFRSSSQLGTFGIQNDQWFSDKDQGPAIQQFLAGITQVDNAIANIIDAPTLQRVKASLATAQTTFSAGIEHQATEFGTILKDRYHTVVEAIDPELTHLVDGFQGTGDELGKFVVDIVSVSQTLKSFNAEDLFGQLVTVDDVISLQHAGETVSQTFTRITSEFALTNAIAATMGKSISTAFGELGLASEAARADLIQLMGGLQAASAAFTNYLNVAFTDAERQARAAATATQTLNNVFGDLNIAVPNTWAELNTFIDSLDLTTEAGRQTYAMFIQFVVPAFYTLHGSAQDTAGALDNQTTATDNLGTAAATVINPMMGVIEAFHQLRSAADIAGEHLSNTISQNDAVLSFAGGKDNQSRLTAKFNLITGELNSLEAQLDRYKPGGDLSQTDNAFGEVATLQKQINPLQDALGIVGDSLGHLADLTTQYGGDIAEKLYTLEQSYATARDAAAGNDTALGILETSFNAQWNAIVSGTGDAVGSILSNLDDLRAGLRGNFITDAQRIAEATGKLSAGFGALGIAIPQSHREFLDLIDGIDLTTSAGQTLFTALQPLADAFITVHGSAQDAAGAIGDVAKAFDSTARASLNSNFLTDAQRSTNAWSSLHTVFEGLGVAVPATHQDFLSLLDSFDLTTKAGQDAWTSVLGVADAFVTVHGSAQSAADALGQVAKAFDASARGTLNSNFLTDSEKTSSAWNALRTTFDGLGVAIPATHRDFLSLLDSFDLSTQAGQQAFTAITGVADAFITVHGSAQQAANALGTVAAAFDASARATLNANFLTNIEKVSLAETQLEATFGRLGIAIPETHRDFLALVDSFDLSTQAGQQAFSAITGVADAFVTVHGTAQQAADAANAAGKAIENVAKASDDWMGQFIRMSDELRTQKQSIAGWVHNIGLNSATSPLSPVEQLATARANFQNAPLSDSNAAADAYLKVARQVYASGGAYRQIYDEVVAAQKSRAGDQYAEWTSALVAALPANGDKMVSAQVFQRSQELTIALLQQVAAGTGNVEIAVDDVATAIKSGMSTTSDR